MVYHHFCHILFIWSESIYTAHIQREGITQTCEYRGWGCLGVILEATYQPHGYTIPMVTYINCLCWVSEKSPYVLFQEPLGFVPEIFLIELNNSWCFCLQLCGAEKSVLVLVFWSSLGGVWGSCRSEDGQTPGMPQGQVTLKRPESGNMSLSHEDWTLQAVWPISPLCLGSRECHAASLTHTCCLSIAAGTKRDDGQFNEDSLCPHSIYLCELRAQSGSSRLHT